jgi:hypothetical protein
MGDVTFAGQFGKGTTVTVRIPVAAPKLAEVSP